MEHLTLAEAIRKGAAETVRCKGEFVRVRFSSDTDERQYEACALGAAMIGAGFQRYTDSAVGTLFNKTFPELVNVFTQCPACRWKGELCEVIAHINDFHDWTREAIADWIDSISLEIAPVRVIQETPA